MAFRPARDTHYFIIAKHSNMPLGVRGNSGDTGAEIEQQAWNPDSPQPQQHFWLDAAPAGHFFIRPGRRDLFLEPQGARIGQGRENGTPIVQTIWDAGAGHQRFLLMPAGPGYYRIRCLYTGNFWDVFGNTTAVGARLVQHSRTTTDNQLFRLVAVPKIGLDANTTPFQGYANYQRMLVLGLAGVVPKVGGGVSALLGLIWPSDHDQRFWQQMKNYVDVRMTEMLQHQRLLALETDLAGLINNVRRVNAPKLPPTDRWNKLEAMTTGSTSIELRFLSVAYQDSHRILSHLAIWGTLVLGVNTQMARDYDEMHPGMSAELRADGKAEYYKILVDNIQEYTKAVATARAAALAWRLEKIEVGLFGHVDAYVLSDMTGWSKAVAGKLTNQALAARRAQVAAQFEAEMDALMAPVRLWRFLNPAVTERPARETVRRVVGPVLFKKNDAPVEEVTGTIASVSVSLIDEVLRGLVVRYTDGRKRVSGEESSHMQTLTLAPGEYINSAYGVERQDAISGLTFETSRGQLLVTGTPSQSPLAAPEFTAGLDDALDAHLTGFSNSGGGLCFHWEYSWDYDWTGNLPAVPQLAEPAHPARTLLALETETTEAGPAPDFTTREFAAGEW